MSAQGQICNEQAAHELGDVDDLPDVAGDNDNPGQNHARFCCEFTRGGAKGKDDHAAAVFCGDAPHLVEVSRVQESAGRPALDSGKGVAEDP